MGTVLLVGGFVGSVAGVQLFAWLRRAGQVDLAVAIFYVVVLGTVGALMVRESVGAILRRGKAQAATPARAFLDPRPAAEDAVPQVAALHLRHPAAAASAS